MSWWGYVEVTPPPDTVSQMLDVMRHPERFEVTKEGFYVDKRTGAVAYTDQVAYDLYLNATYRRERRPLERGVRTYHASPLPPPQFKLRMGIRYVVRLFTFLGLDLPPELTKENVCDVLRDSLAVAGPAEVGRHLKSMKILYLMMEWCGIRRKRPFRRLTKEEVEEIIRLRMLEGLTLKDIAERVGVSESTISRVLKRAGVR